jgi:hypothetical protein
MVILALQLTYAGAVRQKDYAVQPSPGGCHQALARTHAIDLVDPRSLIRGQGLERDCAGLCQGPQVLLLRGQGDEKATCRLGPRFLAERLTQFKQEVGAVYAPRSDEGRLDRALGLDRLDLFEEGHILKGQALQA